MLWSVPVLLLVMCMAWYRWKRRYLYAAAAKIPSTKMAYLPLIGNGLNFGSDTEHNMNVLRALGREGIENNTPLILWLGLWCVINVHDTADVDCILRTSLEKDPIMTGVYRQMFGNGVVFAPVQMWRHRRRMMAPAFSQKALNHFVNIFSEQSRRLVQNLRIEAAGGDFSVWSYISRYTIHSVCESNLGVKLNQTSGEHPVVAAFNKSSATIANRAYQFWYHSDFIFRLTNIYKETMENTKTIFDFIDTIVNEKKREHDDKLGSNIDIEEKNSKFKSFLEMLIENSDGPKGYTTEELREEVLVIAFAGTDTSAVSASFVLCILARHPDVQQKVYDEIQEVFGDSDRPFMKEDLPKLQYLEAVIRESMRLYPPVPFIAREIQEDYVLPSGFKVAPKMIAYINIWAMHRDPKNWGEDADQFKPERFLDMKKVPPAFTTFSNGPRNCIGNQYAMMSLKTVLCHVLRSYKVLPPLASSPLPRTPWRENESYFRLRNQIMLKDVDNYTIRLECRKGWVDDNNNNILNK